MSLQFKKVTTQKHVQSRSAGHVFDIYYEVLFAYENAIKPVYLIDYKVLHNGSVVMESSKNAKKAWVVPPDINPESDLAFFMLMDSLTSELMVSIRAEEELARGKKGKRRYEALLAYKEVCHLWMEVISLKYPELDNILQAAVLKQIDDILGPNKELD